MNYCPFCGEELPSATPFCPFCGKNLQQSDKSTLKHSHSIDSSLFQRPSLVDSSLKYLKAHTEILKSLCIVILAIIIGIGGTFTISEINKSIQKEEQLEQQRLSEFNKCLENGDRYINLRNRWRDRGVSAAEIKKDLYDASLRSLFRAFEIASNNEEKFTAYIGIVKIFIYDKDYDSALKYINYSQEYATDKQKTEIIETLKHIIEKKGDLFKEN